MRRMLILALVLVTGLGIWSGLALGKDKGDAQAQLEQMEKDRMQAVIKADTATLDKMTADDYVLIDANGKERTKAETMDAIKTGAIKITSNDFQGLKVRVYGNTAVVTGRSTPKGTIDGKDISGTVAFTRVYVKRDGRWQSVSFQQTKVE